MAFGKGKNNGEGEAKEEPAQPPDVKEAPAQQLPKTEQELLEREYKFKVSKAPSSSPGSSQVEFITFEDGRKYKFQHPPFMQVHEVLTSAKNEHSVFVFALGCLDPSGPDSPEINEAYLNDNRADGFYLWSPLVRGLLQSS